MREFFRGWKRKLGVVTLVIACAAMGAWIRSLHRIDFLNLGHRVEISDTAVTMSLSTIASDRGQIRWYSSYRFENITEIQRDIIDDYLKSFESQKADLAKKSYTWVTRPVPTQSQIASVLTFFPTWRSSERDDSRESSMMIPYGSIVVPLTLLSAYLLLSRPRARSQQNSP